MLYSLTRHSSNRLAQPKQKTIQRRSADMCVVMCSPTRCETCSTPIVETGLDRNKACLSQRSCGQNARHVLIVLLYPYTTVWGAREASAKPVWKNTWMLDAPHSHSLYGTDEGNSNILTAGLSFLFYGKPWEGPGGVMGVSWELSIRRLTENYQKTNRKLTDN